MRERSQSWGSTLPQEVEEEEEELNHWDVVSHMLWSAEVEEDSEADRHSSWDMDGVGDSSGPEDSQGPTVEQA